MDIINILNYIFLEKLNFLWIIVIVLIAIEGISYINAAKQKETLSLTRQLNYGYGLFFFAFAIAQLLNLIADYYYDNGLENSVEFQIFKRSSYILGLVAAGIVIMMIERTLLQGKGRIALISFGIAASCFVLPYDVFRVVNYAATPIYLGLIVYLYGSIAMKSSGDLRQKAILIIASFFVFFAGISLDSRTIWSVFNSADFDLVGSLLSPVITAMGLLLFYLARKEMASKYSWKLIKMEANSLQISVIINPSRILPRSGTLSVILGRDILHIIPQKKGTLPALAVNLGMIFQKIIKFIMNVMVNEQFTKLPKIYKRMRKKFNSKLVIYILVG